MNSLPRVPEHLAWSLIDSLSAHICLLDEQGVILATNRAWREFAAGNPPMALDTVREGANYFVVCRSVVGPDAESAVAFLAGAQSVLQGERELFTLEYPCHSPNERRWFVARVTRLLVSAPTYLVITHENVTERRLAEEARQALREERDRLFERLQMILEQMPIGCVMGEAEQYRLTYWNPAAEKIFGYRKEEVLGKSPFETIVSPEARQEVDTVFKQMLVQKRITDHLNVNRTRDGREIECQWHNTYLVDEHGKVTGYLCMVQDVTGKKQLEEQLRQAQKMEAVGRLAGGIAHDFNNILSAILMQLHLVKTDPQCAPSLRESLQELEAEAQRAASITRQLLLFSRQQRLQVRPLDLAGVIQKMLGMLRRLLGEQIRIEHPGMGAPAWIEADESMMEQVLLNLCVNARDAMPQGGRLEIKLTRVQFTEEQARLHPESRPGSFVRLSVRDTGCGMDEPTLKRIFEPFFSTKPAHQGTGLGLATVYGIMKQHHGWIEVESTVQRGSVFHIFLPATQAPSALPVAKTETSVVAGGSEMILLVEDELAVRRVAALCLRKLGYAVLEAANGREALTHWERNHARIDLLLTDMVMPENMTGLELARHLRGEKKELKVIICSGYSQEILALDSFDEEEICFLPKPYQAVELAKTVRRRLDTEGDDAG